jgi:hypothetical protein
MHFTREQIEFYRINGYIAGPRILSDEQIDRLKQRIDDILAGRVRFPDTKALEVIFYSCMLAYEVQDEFRKRGLHFDPKSVEAVAFGEGLVQCAMDWNGMVSHYLGLAKPINNDYQLSVSGMRLLRSATFKERIALSQDVRLFLWELKDGRPMPLFARAQARLSDPQLSVRLPLDPKNIQVFAVSGELLWPHFVGFVNSSTCQGDSPVQANIIGSLGVPVYAALRQLPSNQPAYIVATGVSFDEFRRRW